MIRRDYILRMIQEFSQVLNRIQALKKDQRWNEAQTEVDAQVRLLTGESAEKIIALSETELLARLMRDEPSLAVRDKTFMMATLFKTAGDLAAAQNKLPESRACHLKGLHLLLGLLAHSDAAEIPRFVPAVEEFVLALRDQPLPPESHAVLMQHYERVGEFAKAEDAFFELLEAWPADVNVLNFGIAFYERLLRLPDAQLIEGNLPRAELDSALAGLRQRKGQSPEPAGKP